MAKKWWEKPEDGIYRFRQVVTRQGYQYGEPVTEEEIVFDSLVEAEDSDDFLPDAFALQHKEELKKWDDQIDWYLRSSLFDPDDGLEKAKGMKEKFRVIDGLLYQRWYSSILGEHMLTGLESDDIYMEYNGDFLKFPEYIRSSDEIITYDVLRMKEAYIKERKEEGEKMRDTYPPMPEKPDIPEYMYPDPYNDDMWIKGRAPECGKWYFVRHFNGVFAETDIDYRTYNRTWLNAPHAVYEWQEIKG